MPQFLFRTADGEIDFYNETTRDDVTQDILRPGDEYHVRLAEHYLIEICEIQGLATEKKKILASTDVEEKVKLQASYDEMFYQYWHGPQFSQPNWRSSWLKPLRQFQHFESFDLDFYDEDGLGRSIALEVLRNGMKRAVHKYEYWPTPIPALHWLVKKRRTRLCDCVRSPHWDEPRGSAIYLPLSASQRQIPGLWSTLAIESVQRYHRIALTGLSCSPRGKCPRVLNLLDPSLAVQHWQADGILGSPSAAH